MTTRASLTLTGIDAYLEKVAQAGRDVDQAAGNAVAAGGKLLADGMKRRAPVYSGKDPRAVPGLLRNTLESSLPARDGNLTFVLVGMPRNAPADVARYGNAQEYGTSSMAAQPYIRPAIDEDGPKARAAIRKSLKQDGIL
jgi:HK97 gp10 family phage protein